MMPFTIDCIEGGLSGIQNVSSLLLQFRGRWVIIDMLVPLFEIETVSTVTSTGWDKKRLELGETKKQERK